MEDRAEEIRELVDGLNRAWPDGDFETVSRLFDGRAVTVAPGFGDRLVGREACVQSYRAFWEAARLHRFDAGAVEVDLVGDVAVATYPYETDYELDDGRWKGVGRDLLVCARTGEGWRIVWRCPMPGPEERVAEKNP